MISLNGDTGKPDAVCRRVPTLEPDGNCSRIFAQTWITIFPGHAKIASLMRQNFSQ
jgi:hypothetical protein